MEYFGLCQTQVAVGSKAKNLKHAKRHASLGNVSNNESFILDTNGLYARFCGVLGWSALVAQAGFTGLRLVHW